MKTLILTLILSTCIYAGTYFNFTFTPDTTEYTIYEKISPDSIYIRTKSKSLNWSYYYHVIKGAEPINYEGFITELKTKRPKNPVTISIDSTYHNVIYIDSVTRTFNQITIGRFKQVDSVSVSAYYQFLSDRHDTTIIKKEIAEFEKWHFLNTTKIYGSQNFQPPKRKRMYLINGSIYHSEKTQNIRRY